MPVPLRVRGTSKSRYKTKKFFLFAFSMPGLIQRALEFYVYIWYELHLIKDLKTNIFTGNDVFFTETFTINFANFSAQIISYRMTIVNNVRNKSQFLKRNILANVIIFISPTFKVSINFWRFFLPDSNDFLFEHFFKSIWR